MTSAWALPGPRHRGFTTMRIACYLNWDERRKQGAYGILVKFKLPPDQLSLYLVGHLAFNTRFLMHMNTLESFTITVLACKVALTNP